MKIQKYFIGLFLFLSFQGIAQNNPIISVLNPSYLGIATTDSFWHCPSSTFRIRDLSVYATQPLGTHNQVIKARANTSISWYVSDSMRTGNLRNFYRDVSSIIEPGWNQIQVKNRRDSNQGFGISEFWVFSGLEWQNSLPFYCTSSPNFTFADAVYPSGGKFSGVPWIDSTGFARPSLSDGQSYRLYYSLTAGNCTALFDTLILSEYVPFMRIRAFNTDSVQRDSLRIYSKCTNAYNTSFDFRFDGSSEYVSYQLDFGDGSPVINGAVLPPILPHTYASPGLYIIQLTGTNTYGCSNSLPIGVYFGMGADVSIAATPAPGNYCYSGNDFSTDIQFGNIDSNRLGTLYTLHFNDGSPDTVFTHPPPAHYSHTFLGGSCNSSGISDNQFEIRVRTENPCGLATDSLFGWSISNQPIAQSELPDSVCTQLPVKFTFNGFKGESIEYDAGLQSFVCDSLSAVVWDIQPNTYTLVSGQLGARLGSWNSGSDSLLIQFNQKGNYTLRQWVKGNSACGNDSVEYIICVEEIAPSGFSIIQNRSCLSDSVQLIHAFSDSGGCEILDIRYVLTRIQNGQSRIFSGSNPSIFLDSTYENGKYSVKQEVESPCGISSSFDTLIIVGMPHVFFPASDSLCGPSIVHLGSSQWPITLDSSSGNLNTYLWRIESSGSFRYVNGTDSSSHFPSIELLNATDYRFVLDFTNECFNGKDSLDIRILPQPRFKDIKDSVLCVNETHILKVQGRSGRAPFSYEWRDTNNILLSVQDSLVLEEFVVKQRLNLKITDFIGCSSDTSFSFEPSRIPFLQFKRIDTICYNARHNLNIIDSSLSLSVQWLDPTKVTQDQSFNTTILPLQEDLKLFFRVTDTRGCNYLDSLEVRMSLPTSAFLPDSQFFCSNESLFLSQGDTTNLNYAWTSSPPGFFSNLAQPSVSPSDTTTYFAEITNTRFGCVDSFQTVVYPIQINRPDIFNTPQMGCSPMLVQLSNKVPSPTNNRWYINGVLVSTADSFSIEIKNDSHIQDTNVVLSWTIEGVIGCSDSLSQIWTIQPKPKSIFTLSANAACSNGFSFATAQSSIKQPAQYIWRSSSSLIHIADSLASQTSLQFASSVRDTIAPLTLISISADGCRKDSTLWINIGAKPSALFQIPSGLPSCGNTLIQPLDSSSGTSLQYEWKVMPSPLSISGKNTSQPSIQLIPNPNDSITYRIRLIVVQSNGCSDSLDKMVIVFPRPIAQFQLAADSLCQKDAFQMQNLSSVSQSSSAPLQWMWYTNSGDSSTAENPSFQFRSAEKRDTNYRVYLRVRDAFGCEDTSSKKLRVLPKAFAHYSSNSVIGCAAFVIDTSMLSIYTDSLVNSTYQWEIRDPINQNLISTFVDLGSLRYVLSNANDSVIVNLIAQSVRGCSSDTFGLQFKTLDRPDASFQLGDSVYCSPASVSRIDSSAPALIHAWYANSVLVSTSASPHFQWSSNAITRSIDIIHTVEDAQNCADSAQTTIRIFPQPDVNFQASDACQNIPIQFTFQNIQSDSIVDALWLFGDGDSSRINSPSHAYASNGKKYFTLIVTNVHGCSQSFNDSLEVLELALASFTASGTGTYGADTVCLNEAIAFSALVQASITQWQWDIGSNGIIDYTGPIAQHTFADTASTLVALYVTNQLGCVDTSIKRMFIQELPTASFQKTNYDACQANASSYSNTSQGNYASFVWRVLAQQSNGLWTSIDSSYSQVFNLPALGLSELRDTNYIIQLSLNSGCGRVFMNDTVLFSPSPIAFATANKTSGCSPYNTSLSLNGKIKGSPDYVLVNWGDGSVRDSILPIIITLPNGLTNKQWPNLSHPYIYNGPNVSIQYNLSIRAVNSCGQSTFTLPIQVNKRTLQASFNIVNPAQCAPGAFNFVSTATGGSAVTQWCFNYDTLNMSCLNGFGQGPTTNYTYSNAGTYTIAQFITNGCSVDTAFQTITLYSAPQVSFSDSNPVCISDSVFFNSSIVLNSGTIQGIKWFFGDGDSSISLNPAHLYANSGTYSVCLEVSTDQGCTKQFCKDVIVRNKPTAAFSIIEGCIGNTAFNFTNTSTAGSGSLGNSLWDFGDGQAFTGLNASHTYAAAGTYNLSLVQFNSFGCSDSLSIPLIVSNNPNSGFTYSIMNGDSCAAPVNYQFTVTDTSLHAFQWDFDFLNAAGSNVSNDPNPNHTFSQAGSYTVQLIAQTLGGCVDTQFREILVHTFPEMYLLASRETACSSAPIAFSDTIRLNGQIVTAVNYEWNFGDGMLSNDPNPTHSYLAGSYVPILRAQMPSGCWYETVGDTIEIYQVPDPNFVISAASLESYFFIYSGGLIDSNALFFWDFGDGNNSQLPNPEHTYTDDFYDTDQEYKVCLNVISSEGCDSTLCKDLVIRGYRFNVPNAFAPDLSAASVGDGNVFLPKGHALKEYKLEVFDPEGNLVFQTTELDVNGIPSIGWNGRIMNGDQLLPMGVYVWKIEARYLNNKEWEGKEFGNQRTQTYGTVTLIR